MSNSNGLIKVVHFQKLANQSICNYYLQFLLSKLGNVETRPFEKVGNIVIEKRQTESEIFSSSLHRILLNISANQMYQNTVKLRVDFLQNELHERIILAKVS